MAEYRLSGYYRIDELYESDVEELPGVYLFYRTMGGPVRYVGRLGTSLRRRITGRPYRYYRCKYTYDEAEAYYWECRYYHQCEDTIDNINHPAKPSGYFYSECPVCGQ